MNRAFSKPLKLFLMLCAAPFALGLLFIGCKFAAVLTTRPFLWSTTRHKPSKSELAGTYRISPASAAFADSLLWGASGHATIELRADHSAVWADFPNTDGFGKPDSTASDGEGIWSLEEPGLDGIRIDISDCSKTDHHLPHKKPQFDSVGYGGILLGHTEPYELYFGIGDPDDGEGIVFERVR